MKTDFKELKELDLSRISSISFLEKVKFKKLDKLNLMGNKNLKFDRLEKVKFKELKELILCACEISNTSFLKNVNL